MVRDPSWATMFVYHLEGTSSHCSQQSYLQMSGREAPKGTDHRVLLDSIQVITKPGIHYLALHWDDSGDEAHLGADLLRDPVALKVFLENVNREVVTHIECAMRKISAATDVVDVLKRQSCAQYKGNRAFLDACLRLCYELSLELRTITKLSNFCSRCKMHFLTLPSLTLLCVSVHTL